MHDIEGIKRIIGGFNKIPDKNGNHLIEIQLELKPIDLNYLRSIFNVNANDPDPVHRDMIYDYNIDETQAKLLQPYVINGKIDLDAYDFCLGCNSLESP